MLHSIITSLSDASRGVIFGDHEHLRFTTQWSAAAWLNLGTLTGVPCLFSKGGGLSPTSYAAYVATNRKLRVAAYSTGGAGPTIVSNTDISSTDLQHWTFTFSAYSEMKLYCNGVLDAIQSITTATYVCTQPLVIGGAVGASVNTWGGDIFDCRLFGRTLSADEAALLHRAQCHDMLRDGLVHQSMLATGENGAALNGTILHDHSPYALQGTVIGAGFSSKPDPYSPTTPHVVV